MVRIIDISVKELKIPFKQVFSHASASRDVTQSILVRVELDNGLIGYGEGCPREYVTNETIESAIYFIEENMSSVINSVFNLNSLLEWISANLGAIQSNPSAWCALETALIDVLAKQAKCSVEEFLGISVHKDSFKYTAVIGNGGLNMFEKQVRQYEKMKFTDFKLKLSGNLQNDNSRINLLTTIIDKPRIRVDANNLWHDNDVAIDYIQKLPDVVFAIEEPLADKNYKKLTKLSQIIGKRIILDESLKNREQLTYLVKHPECWIANVRVSKMGGILNSLEIIQELRKLKIPIIIGAHVGETSILTRAAMVVAQSVDDSLLAQEGAFGTYLLSHDICDKSLMFHEKGEIKSINKQTDLYGLGLKITSSVYA